MLGSLSVVLPDVDQIGLEHHEEISSHPPAFLEPLQIGLLPSLIKAVGIIMTNVICISLGSEPSGI